MNTNTRNNAQKENSIMSLYIPHVFDNITKEEIIKTFKSQSLGQIKSIDFVSKVGKNNVPYNAAYLHFDYWFNNTAVYNFQEKLKNPEKECRVIYDDPWYWVVLENKTKKHLPYDRKPRIALQDLTEQLKSVLSINIDTTKSHPPQIYTPCPTDLPVTPVENKKTYASILKPQEEKQALEFDLFANIEKIKQKHQEEDIAIVAKAYQDYLDMVEREQFEAEHQQMLEEEFDKEVEQDWKNQQELIKHDCLEVEELEKEPDEIIDDEFVDANYAYYLEQENFRLRYEMSNMVAFHQNYVLNYSR